MWLTKKILVATDFGESARVAADSAVDLARAFRVPLVLVHTYMVPSFYAVTQVAPMTDYMRAYQEAAQEMLEKERARLAEKGVEVSAVLRDGVAWEEILSVAKDFDVGLVVMGTHGRRGLPRALLGSVAEKVVRLSTIPVLTLHAESAA
jgi:nucleotide-binding universal stress UspA family protein